MTKNGEYEYLAWRFNQLNDSVVVGGGYSDLSDAQHKVIKEEFEEYIEAYVEGDTDDVSEEMADVIITIMIQAHRMGIDIAGAYDAKMEYNLQKSGDKDENGKIVDDAEIEKPDFSQFTNGFSY